MPDVRRHPIVAAVFATLLAAILGNSGLACACALAALDAPVAMHHEMTGDHADMANSGGHECGAACGHAAIASISKAPDAGDQRSDKPQPIATHHGDARDAFVPGPPALWQYKKQHPALPLSTPVSRSDILLD
ncbi:MAG: hypothetical protein L0Y45_08590 [Woeseiaceae bacterium]|nr:hypothetical protein [Woeseiaceae bacterium]